MFRPAERAVIGVILLVCVAHITEPRCALPDLRDSLLSFTGGVRAKLVYVDSKYRLMGFDTDESTPRVLTQGVRMQQSLITQDGQQTLFSRDKKVYAVNWDGTDERLIGDGVTADLWYDRVAKVEWVYCWIDWDLPIRRYRIDDPSIYEQSCAPHGASWLSVHQSGTKFVCERTIYTTPECSSDNKGYGCWHSYSPDPRDPDRILALQGGHRYVRLHPDDTVYMAINPGVDEVWEVRWTNNRRFITYTSAGACWAARFNAEINRVERMLPLTDGSGNVSPRLWLDPGCEPDLSISRQPADVVAEDGKRYAFVIGSRTCDATFQWRKDGAEIPGATGPTLSFDSAAIDDDGSRFSCAVSADGSTILSRQALLTVHPDTIPPTVIAIAPYGGSMTVMFSERVTAAAANKANYTIAPGVTVTGAAPEISYYRVSHNGSIAGRDTSVYTLTISGVADMSSRRNPLSPNPLVLTFSGKGLIDTEAPTPPGTLSAISVTARSVVLSWSVSRDNIRVAGYQIFRDGIKVGTTLSGVLSYSDDGLEQYTRYEYTVRAQDKAGNLSVAAAPLEVTTADPVFSVLAPGSGDTYSVGSQLPIRYRVDRDRFSGEMIAAVSIDNGRQWFEVVDQGFVPTEDTGTILWTIPDSTMGAPTASSTCRVRIYDYARTLDPVMMDGTFTIQRSSSARAARTASVGAAVVRYTAGHLEIQMRSAGRYRLRVFELNGAIAYNAIVDGRRVYRLPMKGRAKGIRLVRTHDLDSPYSGHSIQVRPVVQ